MESYLEGQDSHPYGQWLNGVAGIIDALNGDGVASGLTGLFVLLPPVLLVLWWQWFRRRRAEEAASRLQDRAVLLERAMDTASDGWFCGPSRGTRRGRTRTPCWLGGIVLGGWR